jgi:hypothetical protein
MKRRLEEPLEECLAALAGGQSTLEECLALYPELAAELEPLLHTARRLQDGYAVDPSPLYAQAARERFLAAMARRRQRRLEARPVRPFWRWAPAALGSAAVVAFAVWASVLAWGGGGGGSQEPPMLVNPVTPTSTPVPVVSDIQQRVAKVQANLEIISAGAESGAVEAVAIHQLKEDTTVLVASLDQPQGLEPEDVSQIGEVLADQKQILSEMKERVAPEVAQDLDDAITIAQAGLDTIQKYLPPTPSATPTATPSAIPSATPTPTATPEESATSTATPTPTETPTPEVTPTETPQPTPSPTPEGGEEPTPTATAAP